jgi:hypothetical protein
VINHPPDAAIGRTTVSWNSKPVFVIKVRLPSRRPGFRLYDSALLAESISGPSIVGIFLLENRRLLKYIQVLWNKTFAQEERDCHQHDAYSMTLSLHGCVADADAYLASFLNPNLEE